MLPRANQLQPRAHQTKTLTRGVTVVHFLVAIKGVVEQLHRHKAPCQLRATMPTAQEEVDMNKLIEKLQVTGNVLKRKYEAENQRMKELNQLQRQVQAKILEQAAIKQKKGGLDACALQDRLAVKRLSFLELRVNDLKRKLSLQSISNRKRKNEINSLRQQMVLFDTVHSSLSVDFESHKESMARLMDESNDVYNERQDALENIRELVALDLEESSEHRRVMDELGELLEKEAAAREFIEKATKKQKAAKVSDVIEESKTKETENALKSKISDLKRNLKATQEHIKSVDARFVTANAAFAKLRSISGLDTTREIVDLFIMNEDENYSLFNFIQQTKEEVDLETNQILVVHKNMDRFKQEQSKLSDHEYKVINDLKARRYAAEDKIGKVMRILARHRLNLSQICTGVSHVFAHLGCDLGEQNNAEAEARPVPGTPGTPSSIPKTPTAPTAVSGVGGGVGGANSAMLSEGVQETNIMLYLGVIEQRSNEVIQEYVKNRALSSSPARPGVTIRVANPFGPAMPLLKSTRAVQTPAPPVLDDALVDIEEDDDVVKPLDRANLLERVSRTVDRERAATLVGSESAPELARNRPPESLRNNRIAGKRVGKRGNRSLGTTK